jgi:NhaC family Na+:H+ antiporter
MTPKSDDAESSVSKPLPSLGLALAPVLFLLLLMGWAIGVEKLEPHLPLFVTAVFTAIVGRFAGRSWNELQDGMLRGIQTGLLAILILLVIGVLIGLWIASGVVPLLIYAGLSILSTEVFLPAAAFICAVVSLATGSSWTTAGTVGVALMGVGAGLGLPPAMVAGAVVSGAYFGDKMSPLSDSTNLAAAVTGVDLFTHIKHMSYTTFPAFGLALLGFAGLGLASDHVTASPDAIATIQDAIAGSFDLSWVLLLAPVVVLVLSIRKVSALPALVAAAAAGALLAWWRQEVSPVELLSIAYSGFSAQTGLAEVDELLSRGGLESMMYAVSLILCALSFGGLMEAAGFIDRLAQTVLHWVNSRGGLVTATVASCVGMNLTASDQYLAIIVPGRMYRKAYRDRGLAAKNLSRTIEDAGTLTSPLFAWNTCGATMMQSLAVSPLAYVPFAFFNLLTPLIAILWAWIGIGQAPLDEGSAAETKSLASSGTV